MRKRCGPNNAACSVLGSKSNNHTHGMMTDRMKLVLMKRRMVVRPMISLFASGRICFADSGADVAADGGDEAEEEDVGGEDCCRKLALCT